MTEPGSPSLSPLGTMLHGRGRVMRGRGEWVRMTDRERQEAINEVATAAGATWRGTCLHRRGDRRGLHRLRGDGAGVGLLVGARRGVLNTPTASAHLPMLSDPPGCSEEFDSRMAQLLADADVVRFDAADQMDPSVGTQTFLQAMLDYIATGRLEKALTPAQSGYEQ